MKYFFLSILILPFSLHAVCRKTPDPKRVVIFIDNNNGKEEVTTAREAACKRGDSFIMFPDPANGGTPHNTKEQLKTILSTLKNSGAAPVSLVISGHDGGGSFSGTQGNISRSDITNLFNEDFPEFKNSVESLYLLGCYTGVKFEVFSWMSGFPELKFIAGYEGSAPSLERVAGHSYIRNLMLREKELINETNERSLRREIESIPFMSSLTSSITVRALQCEDPASKEPTSFYYRSQPINGNKLERLDSKDCVDKVRLFKEKTNEFAQYFDGDLTIPTDTTAGPLRQLYNFYRSSEHCHEGDANVPKGDQALGLLFYPGFAANIARYFGDDLKKIYDDYAALTFEDWKKALETDSEYYQQKIAENTAKLAEAEKNPTAYFAKIEAKIKNIESSLALISQTPFGRQVDAYINSTQSEFKDLPTPPFDRVKVQELIAKYEELEAVYNDQTDSIEQYRDTIKARNLVNAQNKEKVLAINQTPEGFLEWKKNTPLPTRDSLANGNRKENYQALKTLYTYSSATPGVPVQMRQKARAVSKSLANMMGNLKCLPLSWHEANNRPLETPRCGIESEGSESGDVEIDSQIYFEMFKQ